MASSPHIFSDLVLFMYMLQPFKHALVRKPAPTQPKPASPADKDHLIFTMVQGIPTKWWKLGPAVTAHTLLIIATTTHALLASLACTLITITRTHV